MSLNSDPSISPEPDPDGLIDHHERSSNSSDETMEDN